MADVTLPQLGETVTEGTITQWFKQVGDDVAADEPLFEVSTDKVDTEVPAPAAGKLTEIRAEEGETVDVGTVIAVIGDASDASGGGDAGASDDGASEEPAAEEPAAEEPDADEPATEEPDTRDEGSASDESHAARGGSEADDEPATHNGTLPCLRWGSSSRLVRSIARPATSLRRVSAGSMTSSMKPRSAAAYGLA